MAALPRAYLQVPKEQNASSNAVSQLDSAPGKAFSRNPGLNFKARKVHAVKVNKAV